MRLEAHDSATAFLAVAAPVLDADESRHNLIHGICSTLIDEPGAYRTAHLWTIHADEVVGAALMTPPFFLVVAQPLTHDALPFAARALHEQGVALPGVTGALPESDEFAQAWKALAGVRVRKGMSQGIYAARAVRLPDDVPGESRPARSGDRGLLIEWLRAFQAEALPPDSPHGDLEDIVDRRLKSETAGFELWEDGSKPVSLCGYGGQTPHGIRIGPVYTPPDLRGRGYASALVARVTKQLLDGGRDYCFLYTDLANPTSNRIYMNVGYSLVCESAEFAFDPSPIPNSKAGS
jgi:predicted GNAT family acetyltransferase